MTKITRRTFVAGAVAAMSAGMPKIYRDRFKLKDVVAPHVATFQRTVGVYFPSWHGQKLTFVGGAPWEWLPDGLYMRQTGHASFVSVEWGQNCESAEETICCFAGESERRTVWLHNYSSGITDVWSCRIGNITHERHQHFVQRTSLVPCGYGTFTR